MRQTFAVALLSVLLPILLIELPTISAVMGSIRGTYDVLTIAVALPRSQVFQLIPRSVQQGVSANDTLLEVSSSVWALADPEGKLDRAQHHVVLLQMGYQISTGPGPSWVPKFSFNELKLDIPFVKHPSGKSGKPLVYKQTMIFSNSVIKMGSSATGLTSKMARFTPDYTPHSFTGDSQTIEYEAEGFVKAHGDKREVDESEKRTVATYKELTQEWWFGVGTGEKVQRFEFDYDKAEISPTPYDLTVELDLGAFAVHDNAGSESRQHDTVHVRGIGWRSRTSFYSLSSSVKDI